MFLCSKMPPGFGTKEEHSMRIIFYALLPVQCWRIQDSKEPKVYLRFGNDMLGNWKYDYGPGVIGRYTFYYE